MKLDLRPVFQEPGSVKALDYKLDLPAFSRSGVQVDGTVSNRAGVVTMTGRAAFELEAACDRCAKVFRRRMRVPFEDGLVLELSEPEQDQDEWLLLEDGELDLDAYISSEILLAMPTQLLCRADCKGLCPQCGQDWNEGTCTCRAAVDPRMEALLQLLDD
ncbi:MAG: YceD family protein [Clostridiales bacterium]|nr:YceD family protein [Clostridiales bacterium]